MRHLADQAVGLAHSLSSARIEVSMAHWPARGSHSHEHGLAAATRGRGAMPAIILPHPRNPPLANSLAEQYNQSAWGVLSVSQP